MPVARPSSSQRAVVVLLGIAAVGAIFAMDLQMPRGVAVAVLYVPVIAFGALLLARRWVLALGLLTTALTLLGWVFSSSHGPRTCARASRRAPDP